MLDDVEITWKDSSGEIILGEDELHLWYADLDAASEFAERLACILSEDERLRAARYVYVSDRNKFVAGRAILRTLLGRYLNNDPKSIDFSYSDFGKPSVSGSMLKFNLSHSGSKAVYAFSLNLEVGTDIEKVRSNFNEMELAGQFFSSEEIKALRSLPPSLRKRAFFHCWARKEAFIKAQGQGLYMRLDSFSVPVLPFYSDQWLPIKSDIFQQDIWKLKIIKVDGPYCAAVAVMRDYEKIKFWNVPPEFIFFHPLTLQAAYP